MYVLSALFIKKLNDMCGLKDDNIIYSLIPSIDGKTNDIKDIYTSTLDKIPLIIDSSLEIFGNKKSSVAKSSYQYQILREEKDNLIKELSSIRQAVGLNELKISTDKHAIAFAVCSSIYLKSLIRPVQFFLPHTSLFSGHWEFWDKIDYLELTKKLSEKKVIFEIKEKLSESNVWKIKFKPDDFPEIVKRRLIKEDLLDKKLDSNALIKAMIIRMGELATPSINYEIIDFSIRSFFTYLGVKKYLRMDREILFLRTFEKEMKDILVKI